MKLNSKTLVRKTNDTALIQIGVPLRNYLHVGPHSGVRIDGLPFMSFGGHFKVALHDGVLLGPGFPEDGHQDQIWWKHDEGGHDADK